ncbi:glycosyltransferase [Burkholderia ubonensis]|uniref:glycosyltransferase n=1 Tax=Burkholderia ubonensis TaxID=101571 RepID=UPI0007C69110|nr:glycosyltransferase [Burkholderia ubonensis]
MRAWARFGGDMRVVHVITCLEQGGAEGVLFRLATFPSSQSTAHIVVSLQGLGFYGPRLLEKGIAVIPLGMPKGRVTLSGLHRLYGVLRNAQPDVVQTWMYHSDLIGGLVARFAGIGNLAWGVRHANLDRDKNSPMTLRVARLCARLSHLVPRAIVSCSEEATATHKAFGYDATKFVNIPNGYDLNCFRVDASAREATRRAWNIGPDETLLGCVARWDVQKDHPNLLRALRMLAQQGFRGRCVLVGRNMDEHNAELMSLIRELGIERRVMLVGLRDDIPSILNAVDLLVLSSSGEAFPNVLVEAMACGTPVVTTDVGDARMIVGDTGWVVRPQDSADLASGLRSALDWLRTTDRAALAARCRQRVEQHFSLQKMVCSFERVWADGCTVQDVEVHALKIG